MTQYARHCEGSSPKQSIHLIASLTLAMTEGVLAMTEGVLAMTERSARNDRRDTRNSRRSFSQREGTKRIEIPFVFFIATAFFSH